MRHPCRYGTLTFWDATPIVRDPGKGALRSAE